MSIKLEIEPYCQECPEFEIDVDKKSERVGLDVDKTSERVVLEVGKIKTNTVIRCKYRKRCQEIAKYLREERGVGFTCLEDYYL